MTPGRIARENAFGYSAPPAGVAQLVEQRIRNAKVDSSSPSIGTMKSKGCDDATLFIFNRANTGLSEIASFPYPNATLFNRVSPTSSVLIKMGAYAPIFASMRKNPLTPDGGGVSRLRS